MTDRSAAAPDDGGTYVLLVSVPEPIEMAVGALGARRLAAGAYGYVGSALGTGGFARVDRHRELAAGERDVRHWHVDSLLGHPATDLVDAVRFPGAAVECALATELRDRASGRDAVPIPGFGASDCDCGSHLVRRPSIASLRAAVRAAGRATGLDG